MLLAALPDPQSGWRICTRPGSLVRAAIQFGAGTGGSTVGEKLKKISGMVKIGFCVTDQYEESWCVPKSHTNQYQSQYQGFTITGTCGSSVLATPLSVYCIPGTHTSLCYMGTRVPDRLFT
eukprot:1040455-Rhodomonas_salina.2